MLKSLIKAACTVLAIIGLITVAVIIYYYPVIDRLYVRPCHYYPQTFADCQQ